jgi:hypothetical protein
MTNPSEAGPTTPTPSGPLDYAQKPPRLTRRRVRGVILMTIGMAAIFTIPLWRETIRPKLNAWYHQWQLTRLQAECMEYAAPPEQVVYEEDIVRAEALAKDVAYRAIPANVVAMTNAVSETAYPLATPPPVTHVPPLWSRFLNFNGWYQFDMNPGLVFMHERVGPGGGAAKLVCVSAMMEAYKPPAATREQWDAGGLPWGMRRALYAWTIERGSGMTPEDISPSGQLYMVTSDAVDRVTFFTNAPAGPIAPPFPLRLYAGQVDPNNASRFTIDYELAGTGHRGKIVGELKDDGSIWLTPDAGVFDTDRAERTWKVPTTRPVQR